MVDADHRTTQKAEGRIGAPPAEFLHRCRHFAAGEREPEFTTLMHDREEQLVPVTPRLRPGLQGQEFLGAQISLVVRVACPIKNGLLALIHACPLPTSYAPGPASSSGSGLCDR